MGDPGVAKSQMLGYIDRLAPRSKSFIYYYRTCRLLIVIAWPQFWFQNNLVMLLTKTQLSKIKHRQVLKLFSMSRKSLDKSRRHSNKVRGSHAA